MFFIKCQLIIDVKIVLNSIAHRIQTSISHSVDHTVASRMMDRRLRKDSVFLFKVTFIYCKDCFYVNIMIFKYMVYPVWRQFFMRFIRHILYKIADLFSHFLRKADSKALF